MMLRNLALFMLAVMLRQQPASPEPSWPVGHLPEPELLAGVAPCKCVDIRQCPSVLDILRRASASRGPPSAELNRLKRSTCGFHGFVPFVCCPGNTPLEPRINLTPNTIGHGSSQTLHKKSYHPDYPEHSPEYHHSFVPISPSYPDSKTDFHSHGHSRPLSYDDSSSPGFHKAESSYEREKEEEEYDYDDDGDDEKEEEEGKEEDQYSAEEFPEIPSKTHFSNHPPHVHDYSYDFSDSSTSSMEHSSATTKPWKHKPRHTPQTTPGPVRCEAGTAKVPVNVSVFSRGGVKEMAHLELPCEKEQGTSDQPVTVENSTEILREIQKAADSPGVRLLPGNQCGVTVDERIVGGKEAELGAFPWIARIGYTRNSSSSGGPFLYRCGGSLLNERYVLTAAHCVINLPGGLELATVRLGEHDERSDPDCKTPTRVVCAEPVQDFRPEDVIVHPQYDNPKYSSDLALIRLDRPARLSTYVSPICLPFGELAMKNYTGLKATVAGWGATHVGLTSSSPVLQWVRLGVVDASRCAMAYERAEVQIDGWRQLCAGGERMADSCDGDSGGPLMRPEQPSPDSLPRYFIVGVVSFGARVCGTEDMPGVYTRVAAFLRWIVDALRP
ncbi:serine proteinase stubble [Anabrus simplex]|uniref:serine proteinase stubble n=1 Tax=Anabrus simplex TaxID=316456 RepID=UPI0035A305CE